MRHLNQVTRWQKVRYHLEKILNLCLTHPCVKWVRDWMMGLNKYSSLMEYRLYNCTLRLTDDMLSHVYVIPAFVNIYMIWLPYLCAPEINGCNTWTCPFINVKSSKTGIFEAILDGSTVSPSQFVPIIHLYSSLHNQTLIEQLTLHYNNVLLHVFLPRHT